LGYNSRRPIPLAFNILLDGRYLSAFYHSSGLPTMLHSQTNFKRRHDTDWEGAVDSQPVC
jgi:hypothetical protein